jgi:hypothetical protein
MEHIAETVTVGVDPDRLWQEIGTFQGVGTWHPMLAEVSGQGEQPGATRTARGKDGSAQVERLVEVNQPHHFYRYVMEESAMPVADYSAEFRVREDGRGVSAIEWTADFEVTAGPVAQTSDMVRGFLEAGLRQLEERYR